MALFDFLKRRKKQEKAAEKSAAALGSAREEHVEHVEKGSGQPRVEVAGQSVLIAPHVTERARDLSAIGQYTFRIIQSATKKQVSDTVEKMYGVHVERVQIVSGHEKPRRRGLTWGTKKGYKKAVVALRKGEAIDIF